MLLLSQALQNQPVMSLRTSQSLGRADRPIINPNNLKLEGWYCKDRFTKNVLVLQSREIRDILPNGLVVNDHDALSDPDDLVRLKSILDLKFEIIGKEVVTSSGQKLGKINDYAVDKDSLYIQKLYVSQSLLKNFTGGGLSVDRSQIVEITNRKVIVQDLAETEKSIATATAPAT